MKHIALAFLATAALAAGSARAETHFRFGVNVGAPVYRTPAPVIVAPPVAYAPPPAVVVAPAPRGYWKEMQVKTWVPERWVVRHNRWGRPERYCEPGYYTYTTQRVWVDARDDRRPDHRGYGYGYGPDRHDSWRR